MVAPPDTCSGVKIGPGATPLTRIPFWPELLGQGLDSSSPPSSERNRKDLVFGHTLRGQAWNYMIRLPTTYGVASVLPLPQSCATGETITSSMARAKEN